MFLRSLWIGIFFLLLMPSRMNGKTVDVANGSIWGANDCLHKLCETCDSEGIVILLTYVTECAVDECLEEAPPVCFSGPGP